VDCFAAIAHDRLWHIRDIARPQIDFRFGWKSGHATDIAERPNLTHLRHQRAIFAVMHCGFLRNGVVMCGPKPEEGLP
jgi:hypothetical protein